MSPHKKIMSNALYAEECSRCVYGHFVCSNNGVFTYIFNIITKLSVALNKNHPVLFFSPRDVQMFVHAQVISKRGRVRFCYGMRVKDRERVVQVWRGGCARLKMCSEFHSMESRTKAFGDNLYVLGREAYVDCHLLSETVMWGGGILFVAAWRLLSLAFGFPYLFIFCVPLALLAKMAATAIAPCYVMFRMDEMGSCYVFRERQHAIVLQYKPRQNALDCPDMCLEELRSHVTFLE